MECERIRELMDLGIDGDLTSEESLLFYGHIHDCPQCAEEYTQLSRLLKEIRHSAAPTATGDYWNDIWHTVRQRALSGTAKHTWWMMHRIHVLIAAVPAVAVAVTCGVIFLFGQPPDTMTLPEASRQHGMVVMSHPFSDPGLSMLAVSDGTLASYDNQEKYD
jgi:predicted anti-sigma-YlaC factor YlaD